MYDRSIPIQTLINITLLRNVMLTAPFGAWATCGPIACAVAHGVAEFVEYEDQELNDQLQTECPVESEHVEYLDIEATEIRSRRERGVRKRRNEDMVYS